MTKLKHKNPPLHRRGVRGEAPHITEFTCIIPTTGYEKPGDKFILGKQEYYWNSDKKHGRSLLFFLDHPDNYRASIIRENGFNYIIPKDRVRHYSKFIGDNTNAPDFNKLIQLKEELKNKIDHLNQEQIDKLSIAIIEINLISEINKHGI